MQIGYVIFYFLLQSRLALDLVGESIWGQRPNLNELLKDVYIKV